MNITRQMQVHLLHGNHLGVPPPRCATLDAKGGPHGRLADAGHHLLVHVRPQGLAQTDGGGGLALSQRRGGDTRDDDVIPRAPMLEAVAHVQVYLRLILAVKLVVVLGQAVRLGHKLNLVGYARLCDRYVAGRGARKLAQLLAREALGVLLLFPLEVASLLGFRGLGDGGSHRGGGPAAGRRTSPLRTGDKSWVGPHEGGGG
mmetsp:Transcript_34701/g.55786  ORF Transcript_34701/g.55786 Transcript_34701/m.55786 type:complete len:202 (-) Transcript_34701:79-684(-)